MNNKFLPLYKKIIVDSVTQVLPKCSIYLFGSRARNTNREGADIDVALDNQKVISFQDLMTIRNNLEDSHIPVNMDIVDLHAVSQDFKNKILPEIVVWKK